MKRFLSLAIVLSFSFYAVAQAGQTQPAANPSPAPTGRAPIQAKSAAEFQAYNAAVANAQNADATAKAADDFAAKFPDSDLRVLLYRAAMHGYQTAGDSGKMLDMGLKVLAIDRDDPEALIGVAEVQEEHTNPTDLDRDQRMAQSIANAQHALGTIDTDLAVPAGTPADKVDAYKKYLRSTALSIVGTIQYKKEQYADAEATLRKAIDADSANPDAIVILRLALALDQEKKYPEALEQTNRAVQLTQENTDVGKMARNERDRLMMQTSNGNAPAGGASTLGASAPTSAAPAGGSSQPAIPANPPQSSAPPSH